MKENVSQGPYAKEEDTCVAKETLRGIPESCPNEKMEKMNLCAA